MVTVVGTESQSEIKGESLDVKVFHSYSVIYFVYYIVRI